MHNQPTFFNFTKIFLKRSVLEPDQLSSFYYIMILQIRDVTIYTIGLEFPQLNKKIISIFFMPHLYINH